MNPPAHGAFAMVAIAFSILALAGRSVAQETGKVEGRVFTSGGQPLSGAQVSVLGTRMGCLTNSDGYYFLDNVPAGLHDLHAQFIGYRAETVVNQRVLAGQTTTLGFTLAETPVAIDEIEVIGERAPLLPRDQVSSKGIVTGELVDQLPVDDPRQVVSLQPGVVETNRARGLSIRGGRSGEEAVYLDGVLLRNFGYASSDGDRSLRLGTNSLSEADVITGGFSAEFGEAQSGIINYVTRTGGRRWNGAGSFSSDEMFPKETSLGTNRVEISVGGPIKGGMTFFGALTAQGNRYANTGKLYRHLPIYYIDGVDTTVTVPVGENDQQGVVIPRYAAYDGRGQVPNSNGDAYTWNGKLDYSFGAGSRIFLSAASSRSQDRLLFGTGTLPCHCFYDPSLYSGELETSGAYLLGWTQTFVRSAEHALSFDLKLAATTDQSTQGVLDHSWEVEHRGPFAGFTFSDFRFLIQNDCHGRVGCIEFPLDQRLLAAMLSGQPGAAPLGLNNTEVNWIQPFRLNPYALAGTSYPTAGVVSPYAFSRERDLQLRAAIDWQVNRYNRVKIGGDYTRIDTGALDYPVTNDLVGSSGYLERPRRSSLFAQDRIDLGDIVVEAGLRLDRFDPNSTFPKIPGYFHPDSASTLQRAYAETALSPRLGVSFPVTARSTFRLSYGHFVQTPELAEEFEGKNSDTFDTGAGGGTVGRPLRMPRKIAYEFGFRQALGPDLVMDIAAYERFARGDISYRSVGPVQSPRNPGTFAYFNLPTNGDYGTAQGIDLRLDRRFSRIFSAMLAYGHVAARNTGTDPFSYLLVGGRIENNARLLLGLPPDPPNAGHITEESRAHNFTGSFSITVPGAESSAPRALRDLGAWGTFRVASGLPYTRVTLTSPGIVIGPPSNGGGSLTDGEVETGRTPWIRSVDLRITRGLRLKRVDARVFIDGRNIFDFTNKNQVFLTTGDVTDPAPFNVFVESAMTDVGGGTAHDIDLRSVAAAGATNLVNLITLRRAEGRFGNGDGVFTLDEQRKTFMAAALSNIQVHDLEGPGRRLRLGVDFSF